MVVYEFNIDGVAGDSPPLNCGFKDYNVHIFRLVIWNAPVTTWPSRTTRSSSCIRRPASTTSPSGFCTTSSCWPPRTTSAQCPKSSQNGQLFFILFWSLLRAPSLTILTRTCPCHHGRKATVIEENLPSTINYGQNWMATCESWIEIWATCSRNIIVFRVIADAVFFLIRWIFQLFSHNNMFTPQYKILTNIRRDRNGLMWNCFVTKNC